jgi:Family of unknown function (DUF6600)
MRKLRVVALFPLLLAIGIFAAFPNRAAAQDQQDQADPPGRVGRLNYMQGSVSYQISGDQDWVQADTNRPLTTGDNLWVDNNSRAEVHIGSTAIRLSEQTGLSFLNLDDRTAQLQLPQGTIEVHLRQHSPGDAFEIDTPNLAFTLVAAGEYRIDTDPNGDSTIITVREGAGQVDGAGESFDLVAGRQYTFSGTDQLAVDNQPAPGYDDFEAWCQSRDQRENDAIAARYVSRDVDGYYDLDEYGDWRSEPDYGMVWIPRAVPVGWVPYHVGHWVWIAPWGWTWVDSEPWGFAPFHYGRWALVRGVWGWVPGPIVVRPIYAPALVAFVGGGGLSGVGWFPLGPRDVFVPGYRCSPRYVQNINVTNTRVINVTQVANVYSRYTRRENVTNNYTYAHTATTVTAVSRETFVNARPVGSAAVRVSSEQVQRARVTSSATLQPTRTSYIAANAQAARARPPIPFSQRSTVVRLNPNASINARPTPPRTSSSRIPNPPSTMRPNTTAAPSAGAATRQPPRVGLPPAQPAPRTSTAQPPRQPQNNMVTRRSTTQPQTDQPQTEERRNLRYAPPVRVREGMYDVHPPLDRKSQAPAPNKQAQPQQRSQPRSQPEPRQQPRQQERQR